MKPDVLKGLLLAGAALLSLDQPSFAQTSGTQTVATADNTEAIESVTVTARRRSEALLATPVSVSAFDSKELERRHVEEIDDITAATPSLTFEGTAGNSGDARIFIRGVGNGNPGDFQDPGVGVYIDGAYYGRASGAFLDNIDIQQIEVLRGPQGTLFGRNTIGGAISVTTAKPDSTDFFGDVQAQFGNYNDVRGRVMINVPLIENVLAVRGAIVYERNDGYTFNTFTNTHTDNIDKTGFEGALRFTPTKALTVDLEYLKTEDNSYGRGFVCNLVPNPSAGAVGFQGVVTGLYGTSYTNECNKNNNSHPYDYSSDLNPEAREHTESAVGTINYDFGSVLGLDELSTKFIGAYLNEKPKRVIDFDGTDLNVIDSIDVDREEEASSAEFQLNGVGIDNRLNFVLGLYYSHEDTPSGYVYTDVLPVLDAFFPFVQPQNIFQRFDLNNSSRAVYGQFTFDITDMFSITGGARYTEETKALSLLKYNVLQSAPTVQVGPLTGTGYFTHNFSNMSPMGTLKAKAPERWLDGSVFDEGMIYFTFSEGFKSGGWNANGNNNTSSPGNVDTVDLFAPEKVKSYELGTKFSAFDRRLQLSADVFYMNYDNIQVANIEFINGTIASVINNAARARVQGVDLEGQALLTDSLRMDFSYSITDGKYLAFPALDEGGNPVNLSFEPFFFVYPWKASIGLENRFDLDNGMAITPRIEIDPQGPRYLASSSDPQAIALGRQGAITLVNADVRFDLTPTLSFDFYGKNLTDQRYINDALDLSSTLGNVLTYYAPPLMYGVKLEYKF